MYNSVLIKETSKGISLLKVSNSNGYPESKATTNLIKTKASRSVLIPQTRLFKWPQQHVIQTE